MYVLRDWRERSWNVWESMEKQKLIYLDEIPNGELFAVTPEFFWGCQKFRILGMRLDGFELIDTGVLHGEWDVDSHEVVIPYLSGCSGIVTFTGLMKLEYDPDCYYEAHKYKLLSRKINGDITQLWSDHFVINTPRQIHAAWMH